MIFEDNQADLEAAVERLSGYLEHEVDDSNVVENRANIIDRYMFVVYSIIIKIFDLVIVGFNIHTFRYCSKRCDVLLEHVEEGREAKWFTFT